MMRYGSLIPAVSASIKDNTGTEANLSIDVGRAVAKAGATLSYVGIDDHKKGIDKLLQDEGKRVVVVLDDIDRLDREEIRMVFKLVKLVADFAYTTYVLAFDENEVAAALDEGHPASAGKGGKAFLEKIIQMPFPIPKADKNHMRMFFFNILEGVLKDAEIELSPDEVTEYIQQFPGLAPGLSTPRAAKRYCMALAFSLPTLKGEVNRLDVMLLEGIRVLYPEVYATIREYPTLFSSETQDYREIIGAQFQSKEEKAKAQEFRGSLIQNALKNKNPEAEWAALSLLEFLFPVQPAHDDTEGRNEQRVRIRRYLRRYLAMGIPLTDISDVAFADFIRQAERSTAEQLRAAMSDMIKEVGPDSFLWDLKARTGQFSARGAKTAISALSVNGEAFPARDDLVHPRSLASFVIVDLLKGPSFPSRLDCASQVVQEATPLSFALECFVTIQNAKDGTDRSLFFPEKETAALGRKLAGRIAAAAEVTPLWTQFPDLADAVRMLHIWASYGGKQETRAHITKLLERNPRDAVEFLKSWGRVASEDLYQDIAGIVDPEIVHGALVRLYGADSLIGIANDVGEKQSPGDAAVARFVVAVGKNKSGGEVVATEGAICQDGDNDGWGDNDDRRMGISSQR